MAIDREITEVSMEILPYFLFVSHRSHIALEMNPGLQEVMFTSNRPYCASAFCLDGRASQIESYRNIFLCLFKFLLL